MKDKIIAALDTHEIYRSQGLVHRMLNDGITIVKLGYEALVNQGTYLIPLIKAHDAEVFIDLKMNDIPNTIKKTCESLNRQGVSYVTVHGTSDIETIQLAVDTFNGKVLVVTQLTTEQPRDEKLIFYLAYKAAQANASGVICAPEDVQIIKEYFPRLLCVCPGIRYSSDEKDDQVNAMTPVQALALGADYLVMGRSLIKNYYEEESNEEKVYI